jgi:2-polyprenyl-3-methyl-5-hydroxy-6-metoxy-1,4-benzoquinol methylase
MNFISNKISNNLTGVRANINYGNPLDQFRYIEVLKYTNNKTVLDIACGIGWGSYLISKSGALKCIGADISQIAINTAKENFISSNLEFVLSDENEIPLRNDTFDVVVSFETFEHLPNVDIFFEEIKRVSKNNAICFISTPNRTLFNKNGVNIPQNPFHYKEYLRDEVVTILKKYGFELVEYLGQYNTNDKYEIERYRKFIANYWMLNRFSLKFGKLGRVMATILSKLIFNNKIKDPAFSRNVTPTIVEDGFQPATHYFIFKLSK